MNEPEDSNRIGKNFISTRIIIEIQSENSDLSIFNQSSN